MIERGNYLCQQFSEEQKFQSRKRHLDECSNNDWRLLPYNSSAVDYISPVW